MEGLRKKGKRTHGHGQQCGDCWGAEHIRGLKGNVKNTIKIKIKNKIKSKINIPGKRRKKKYPGSIATPG